MDRAEREARAYADSVRRALGCAGHEPCVEDLIHRAMGAGAVRRAPMRGEVTVAKVAGKTAIYTSSRLTAPRARWCLAHAFTAWAMHEDGFDERESRRLRAAVAAELLLPIDTAIHVFKLASASLVAREFVIPTAATLLREAELLRIPTALVVPGRYVRTRGDDGGRLPTDAAALELLASKRSIGVQRIAVPEDGGVVVRVAA